MATILFVDDDEMERFFAREILEPRGHRVLYAGDGETALRVYRNESVDVVVTDLAMPRLNGLRLIQQLRKHDPEVRVIAASGINADQLDLAQDYGAVAILQKPWDPRVFLDTLQRILSVEEEQKAEFDAVWPTLYAGTELDEEGQIVRAREDADLERMQDELAAEIVRTEDVLRTGNLDEAPDAEEPPPEPPTPRRERDAAGDDNEPEFVDLGLEGLELELEDEDE
jgi:CheY-like chemotaxis protein